VGWLEFLFAFEGRVGRRAYNWFVGSAFLIFVVSFGATPPTLFGLTVSLIISLGLLFWPLLAVGAKRLHDYDKSAWWMLVWLVPPFGLILLGSMMLARGNPSANQFGVPPMR
jgi:uncharacterized membrane protein YhaH (DUF805 family)